MIDNYDMLKKSIDEAVYNTKVTDIHTHLYSPGFGDMLLWGMDDMLIYHYLLAEAFRWLDISYEDFWKLDKKSQADMVWKVLFEDNSPCSESCKGVLTVLRRLGADMSCKDLNSFRDVFSQKKLDEYVDEVFELSGVDTLVMTNDPFDEMERQVWLESYVPDDRFKAALRIDPLLLDTENSFDRLRKWGYDVDFALDGKTFDEVRRFLSDWITKMDALYMGISLPDDFYFPEDSVRSKLIENCILPVCRDFNIPFAMMIGVKRHVNKDIRLAGDSVGKANIKSVENLCAGYPHNKFMVTMLSRENQHELCVAARKFRNLMVFGCWWFLNNPTLVDEITRMRFDLLGVSFIPQHSDARVLDHLIYKWDHSRQIIADVMYDKYKAIIDAGWPLSEEDIRHDVDRLFNKNFWNFLDQEF